MCILLWQDCLSTDLSCPACGPGSGLATSLLNIVKYRALPTLLLACWSEFSTAICGNVYSYVQTVAALCTGKTPSCLDTGLKFHAASAFSTVIV